MGFSEKDTTAQKTVDVKPLEVRVTRNDTHKTGPPVDIFVLKEVDGNVSHFEAPRAAVVANWDGTERTLMSWVLLIVDAAE